VVGLTLEAAFGDESVAFGPMFNSARSWWFVDPGARRNAIVSLPKRPTSSVNPITRV
jgi:hypothetical protein